MFAAIRFGRPKARRIVRGILAAENRDVRVAQFVSQ